MPDNARRPSYKVKLTLKPATDEPGCSAGKYDEQSGSSIAGLRASFSTANQSPSNVNGRLICNRKPGLKRSIAEK